MRFKLQTPTANRNPTNCLEFVLEFMHGDADADSEEIIARFPAKLDGEYIEAEPIERGPIDELVVLIERIAKEFYLSRPNLSAPFAELVTYPGFENWFEVDPRYGGTDYWPGDSTTDHQYIASLQGYSLYFYDANGARRKVDLVDA